jgi:hypothetical protein
MKGTFDMTNYSVLVFIIFMVLKLTGHIAWPWVWVTAPLWIPLGFILGMVALTTVVSFAVGKKGKRR